MLKLVLLTTIISISIHSRCWKFIITNVKSLFSSIGSFHPHKPLICNIRRIWIFLGNSPLRTQPLKVTSLRIGLSKIWDIISRAFSSLECFVVMQEWSSSLIYAEAKIFPKVLWFHHAQKSSVLTSSNDIFQISLSIVVTQVVIQFLFMIWIYNLF